MKAICAAGLLVFTPMCLQFAHAQAIESDALEDAAATTAPYAPFQSSILTGGTNTVNVSRVPVVTSTGTHYYDVALLFTVSATGQLTLASGYPKVTFSPSLIVSGFLSGEYVGPSNVLSGNALINVSGPGVTSGGATEWSLAAASGSSPFTYPCSATWYVGPLTSNPLNSRIQTAKITSTAYSYGVIGSGGCAADTHNWDVGSLIGLIQTQNTITIVSFTFNGNEDQSTPRDQITYTKKQ